SNAALSAAAMIPFAGWAATGTKITRRVVSGFQKHHVIPKAVYKEFGGALKGMGFARDAGVNLKKLPTPFHGNHPAYSERVRQGIQGLIDKGNFDLNGMQKLQHDLRQEINDVYLNGGVERLNDYYKALGY